jgi:S-methylmethionine-dependent homocysteine/selenocysteine methylase
MGVAFIDGAMGTELERRGVDTSGPAWSARAILERPEVVRQIHADYAAAGVSVHTACTFRTTQRGLGEGWEDAARRAVALARKGAGKGGRIAGSIAPLADCWDPAGSAAFDDPDGARREHEALARLLADAGCDLLLCETFPNIDEGLIALDAAIATGLESWLSFTPGFRGDLAATEAIAEGARQAAARGAGAVLVNCAPARRMAVLVREIRASVPASVPVGAYANAGPDDDDDPDSGVSPREFATLARKWIDFGASIIGGCCYATPAHIAEIARMTR